MYGFVYSHQQTANIHFRPIQPFRILHGRTTQTVPHFPLEAERGWKVSNYRLSSLLLPPSTTTTTTTTAQQTYSPGVHRCGSPCSATPTTFCSLWKAKSGPGKFCPADMIDSFQLPLAFLQTTFAVNHGQPVIYWHRWHFSVCTLPPLRRRRRRLPVHPSHLLILSINASRQAGRQAPGYPTTPHPPPSSALALQHPHPSIPLHHSQLKGAAWVPLICSLWICRRLLSVCEL